jgi:organic radical activating enzyme
MDWLTKLLPSVMPNKDIFCNTPWYELHVYWDGSLGICCQEAHKLYAESDRQYNIATMSIKEWFNSDPVKKFRTDILDNKRLTECRRCYVEEDQDGNSRRLKSNQKSVIFTRTAFADSFQQSPGQAKFLHSANNQGHTTTNPIDIHVDLGNFCNLACKMCDSKASSTIASQEVRWGIDSSRKYLGMDWTKNPETWNRFKQQLLELPGLNNIHLMGGETLLTPRFEDLVDFMIEHNRFELCFSFVTNGTVFKPSLLDKLKLFRRVGIEVSLETVDGHNAYQRQGTDTDLVLKNIDQYMKWCNGSSVTVALRPAPSLLSIGYYTELLEYALTNQLVVKSNLCYNPRFLSAEILPESIKKQYQTKYQEFLEKLNNIVVDQDYNASDPNNYKQIIKEQAQMCLSVLQTPTPADSDQELEALVRHCERWDRVYGYDARKLYPEFQEILDQYDYSISS